MEECLELFGLEHGSRYLSVGDSRREILCFYGSRSMREE